MKSVKVDIQMIGAVEIPHYAHNSDAGFDLAIMDEVTLLPGQKKLVSCGFKMAIPTSLGGFGLFGLVVPRSSSAKLSYSLANTVGIIDSSYRGEIMLYIKNNSWNDTVALKRQQRVAQMILVPYIKADFKEVESLDETERGGAGWGSSGTQ